MKSYFFHHFHSNIDSTDVTQLFVVSIILLIEKAFQSINRDKWQPILLSKWKVSHLFTLKFHNINIALEEALNSCLKRKQKIKKTHTRHAWCVEKVQWTLDVAERLLSSMMLHLFCSRGIKKSMVCCLFSSLLNNEESIISTRLKVVFDNLKHINETKTLKD